MASYLDKLKPIQTDYRSKLRPISTPTPIMEKRFAVEQTPVTRANKISQAEADTKIAQAEAQKYKGIGFFGQVAKEIGSTLASSEVGLGKTIAKTFGNQSDVYSQNLSGLYDTQSKLLREIKAREESGQDTSNLKNLFNENINLIQQNKANLSEESNIPKTSTVLGQLGGTALDLLTAGTYGKATQSMKTGRLFNGTKALEAVTAGTALPELSKVGTQTPTGLFTGKGALNVLKGAGIGYAGDVTYGLQGGRGEDRTGVKSFIPGLSTAIGGGIPFIQQSVRSFQNITNPTLKQNKIIQDNAKQVNEIVSNNSPLRNFVQKTQQKGYNVVDDIANTDLLAGTVDNTGTIRTQQAIAELNELISPAERAVSDNLIKEGRKLPLSYIEKQLRKSITDSNLEGEALTRALNNVKEEVAGYALRADKDGFVTLAKIHDAKINKYKTINYLNPASKEGDKIIARTLKEIVENNTKSIDVKNTNKELGRFFAMQDFLERLDGRKVKGAKLGKYFAQTVGGMVGSHFGPIGTIIGAELGGRLKGEALSRTLSGKTGKMPVRSTTLEQAIESGKPNPTIELPQRSNNLGNLNINQSNTIAPIKNGISDSIPQKLNPTKYVEKHFLEAKDVIAETPIEDMVKLGGTKAMLDRIKTNIIDDLNYEKYTDLANKLKTLDTSKYPTISAFQDAVNEVTNKAPSLIENLKSFPNKKQ